MSELDPKERFTDRVADYVKHRPSYPGETLDILAREANLAKGCEVCDLGSGTGILTRLLLERGAKVWAIEPNDAMRRAAESASQNHSRFHSVAASAEDTTLADQSVDLITAAQAFHWFDPRATREECARILRPGGKVALMWNSRDALDTPFLVAYEAFLKQWAKDSYKAASRSWDVEHERFGAFFTGPPTLHSSENIQKLDLPGLTGLAFSSSHMAKPQSTEHPVHDAIRVLFDAFQQDGFVAIKYTTRLYLGSVH